MLVRLLRYPNPGQPSKSVYSLVAPAPSHLLVRHPIGVVLSPLSTPSYQGLWLQGALSNPLHLNLLGMQRKVHVPLLLLSARRPRADAAQPPRRGPRRTRGGGRSRAGAQPRKERAVYALVWCMVSQVRICGARQPC